MQPELIRERRDFALGLYPPPSPNVGRRGGSPQFRIRLSLRAVSPTPRVSCAPPVSRRSLLPSPRDDRLGLLSLSGSYLTRLQSSRFRIRSAGSLPSREAIRPRQGFRRSAVGGGISPHARSLLRGAPALTAAGLAPASLIQHQDRASRPGFVQDAPSVNILSCHGRSKRPTNREVGVATTAAARQTDGIATCQHTRNPDRWR